MVSRSRVTVGSCCWPIIVVGRRCKQAGRHGPLWASDWRAAMGAAGVLTGVRIGVLIGIDLLVLLSKQ